MRATLLALLFPLLLLAACNGGTNNNSGTSTNTVGTKPSPQLPPASTQLTVFAAASVTDVLTEAARRYEAAHGIKVNFSFASSSDLARQIKAGAPADIFIAADQKWMDDVAAAGEPSGSGTSGGGNPGVDPATRVNLLGNELVLIAPMGKMFDVQMRSEFNFTAALPEVKRIAVGDPAHVPAGRYARQSLEALGWWAGVEPLLIPTQDVRAALRLVELGEADAGIVYATDTKANTRVTVVGTFPAITHEPIVYPAALCKDARPGAAEFLAFLRSPEMTKVFTDAGFTVMP